MSKRICINVIGGGSTGISFLAQLIRKIKNNSNKQIFEINIFESTSSLGVGLAYNTESHALLLNSPTEMFSIYAEDSKHFLVWLNQFPEKWRSQFPEIKEINEYSFLPRKLGGLYLKDIVEQTKKMAESHHIKVCSFQDEVINLIENNSSTSIITASGKKYESDYIILCTGNVQTEKFKEFENCSNYFNSPYLREENRIKSDIESSSSVLVLGTRLSAIDAVMLLKENGHKGNITMASREGVLPAVKTELKKYNLKYFNSKNIKNQLIKNNFNIKLDHLLELIQQEASHIYGFPVSQEDILNYPKNPHRSLKIDLHKARRKKVLWEKIPVSFFHLIEEYWKNFSMEEKIDLLNNLSIMQRYTSSFPISNAEKLLSLLNSGQLKIKRKINKLTYNKKEKIFFSLFENENGNESYLESFHYVINATGNGKDLRNSNSPFYTNLMISNGLQFNAFGGLEVSNKNLLVSTKQSFSAKIYAAGPPTFGSFFFTNFIITSAKQTEIIMLDILKNIENNFVKT